MLWYDSQIICVMFDISFSRFSAYTTKCLDVLVLQRVLRNHEADLLHFLHVLELRLRIGYRVKYVPEINSSFRYVVE